MRVYVHLYASLRYYLPDRQWLFREKEWILPDGSTAGHIVDQLMLPEQMRVTVLLNNNSVNRETVLQEGDIIHILPRAVGG